MKKGVRKSNSKGIHIHLTNRWLYTLIAIGILAIVGVVIYADAPSSTIPNPGHPISDLQTCNTAGDVLQINSTGQWSCVPASSIGSSQIGTLVNGKWCTSDGSTISCTSNAPSASTTPYVVNGAYTVGSSGSLSNIVYCPSGYVRSGCSGGFGSTSAWAAQFTIEPSEYHGGSGNGCYGKAFGANSGDIFDIFAYCIKVS
ncbi:MAG: hypothetical protein M1165_02775 [Candidatus Pacearchaeota archaeon]|nr:hypothetical protein [Candidatus Pacearchaeota archaeon]